MAEIETETGQEAVGMDGEIMDMDGETVNSEVEVLICAWTM